MGVPTTSRTTRMPGLQRCCRLAPGSGPRSRSMTIGGRPTRPSAPSSELRINGRRPMPESSMPCMTQADGGARGPRRWSGGVAHLDHLLVGHQLAGPLDQADADAEQRDAEGAGPAQVGGAEPGDGVPVVADLEGEVGDEEAQQRERRTAEEGATWRSARFSGLRVDVGRPEWWAGQARVGDRLVAARGGRRERVVVRAHASTLLLEVRVVWAAIQTAKPTQAPMPTSQANSPSLTGPRPPRPNPP